MKKILFMISIILSFICFVAYAETTITNNVEISGVYKGVNYWDNATYTFEVIDGVAADYGWISNGEYSFKYYHKDSVIKGGGKATSFSCDHIPELIVVPNKIGVINTDYFSYEERNITWYSANDDQGLFLNNNKADTTIAIPEGVTNIPDYVFAHNNSNNKNMEFILPSTLKSIGKRSFSGYSSGGLYINFELPDGLETIGDGAFAQCRYDSLTIPGTVADIGNNAFTYNTRLRNVIFEGNVKRLGSSIFEYCKELKSITFKGDIAPEIDANAFKGFVDGFELYVYYPYNGSGYTEEWKTKFPPNTHFMKVEEDGSFIPDENPTNEYKDEIDEMRLKWRDILLAEAADINDPDVLNNIQSINNTAKSYWESMNTSEDRTRIWSNIGMTSERSLQDNYNRLYDMALAYATIGGELYHNEQLLNDISSAMDFIYDNGYYSSTGGGSGNWWQWQIGIPQKIIRICIMLYDELSDTQKANYMSATRHFQNDITMTGANRMWECEVFIGRGIIEYNNANIQSAKDGISAVLGMVNSGDGFYDDGSFIQHSYYPYTGGYGQSLYANIAEMIYILNDSPWEVNEVAQSNMYNWTYNAYKPFIYKGQFMDMVRGREMARHYSDTYRIGAKMIAAMADIAGYAPERFSGEIKSMIKYWCSENDMVNLYETMSNHSITIIKEIMADETIKPMAEPIMYHQFYNMDRAVQMRPGYGVGISMYSLRIGAFESINSENQRAYHTADGMIYLYNDDLLHYHDGFWPTVNMYRMSGTTVERDTKIDANTRGTSPWAGGVELNNEYGITSMQLESIGQTLKAKKAYFMFDDEIVCLGSDINSNDGIEVETIVENRKLSSADDKLIVNDEIVADEKAYITNWAAIEGEFANIGYYFTEVTTVKAFKENRKGNWNNVATATDEKTYYADYATMFIEHGTNPMGGKYQYAILPDKNSESTRVYAESPDIEILENNSNVQAVKEIKNKITAVNFWNDGENSVGGITSDSHGAIIMQEKNGTLYVAVSDPARTNNGWMNIEIDLSANRIITTDENIIVYQLAPTIKMAINMSGMTGKSYSAVFDIIGDDNFNYGEDIYIIDTPTDDMKFVPDIAIADEYDVYIRWNTNNSKSDVIPLEIVYADGVDDTKYIKQKYNSEIWTYLGTYCMNEGVGGYVKALTDSAACIKEVKFVSRNAQGNSPLIYINMENTAIIGDVIKNDDKIKGVNVKNAQSIGITADLIVAVYDGDTLVNIAVEPNKITAETMMFNEAISYKNGNQIKAFLWNCETIDNLIE